VADLVITAANVAPTSNTNIQTVTAGAAVTAGQVVYLDTAASYVAKLAYGDTAAKATVFGVAMNNAASGQPLDVAVGGDITIGATIVTGTAYLLSNPTVGSAGGINVTPVVAASAQYPALIGMAVSTTLLRLAIASHNNVAA
jgi:hypothetical protein